jgi:uncharacterized protein
VHGQGESLPRGGNGGGRTPFGYRVVARGHDHFLYSGASNNFYPVSPELAVRLGGGRLDPEPLAEIERACGQCENLHGAAAPLSLEELRAQVAAALADEVQQIVLGVTESCNLRCEYCVYSGSYEAMRRHTETRMPWEVARKAIDHLFAHSGNAGVPPGIAFYGGEPLLEFALLQRCARYIGENFERKPRFVITTNGVLLKKQVRDFLVANDFTLIVSMDGPEEVHDRYRKNAGGRGTHRTIVRNLGALKAEHPGYYMSRVRFSVVLAPPNDYAALRDFFDRMGMPCVVSPMENFGMRPEFLARHNNPDFEPLAASFEEDCENRDDIDAPELWRRFTVSFLGPVMRRIQTRKDRTAFAAMFNGQCIPGARKIFINPKGEMYPCEKVEGHADCRIGHVDTGIDREKVEALMLGFADTVSRRCAGCWMKPMCSSCLADVMQGGKLEEGKMKVRCASRQRAQADVMGLYASMLKDNPKALEFLSEAFPWG